VGNGAKPAQEITSPILWSLPISGSVAVPSLAATGLYISPEQPDPTREHVLRHFESLLRRSGDPYTEAFSSSPFNVGAWCFVIFAASAARGVEHYRPRSRTMSESAPTPNAVDLPNLSGEVDDIRGVPDELERGRPVQRFRDDGDGAVLAAPAARAAIRPGRSTR